MPVKMSRGRTSVLFVILGCFASRAQDAASPGDDMRQERLPILSEKACLEVGNIEIKSARRWEETLSEFDPSVGLRRVTAWTPEPALGKLEGIVASLWRLEDNSGGISDGQKVLQFVEEAQKLVDDGFSAPAGKQLRAFWRFVARKDNNVRWSAFYLVVSDAGEARIGPWRQQGRLAVERRKPEGLSVYLIGSGLPSEKVASSHLVSFGTPRVCGKLTAEHLGPLTGLAPGM